MIKAVIVRKNKIIKVVVVASLDNVRLNAGEEIHAYPKDAYLRPGDAHKSLMQRLLAYVGIGGR